MLQGQYISIRHLIKGSAIICRTHVQVAWDRVITTILAAMHDMRKAGGAAAIHMWLLEALAQLIGTQIYFGDPDADDRAASILMPGEALVQRPLTVQPSACPGSALRVYPRHIARLTARLKIYILTWMMSLACWVRKYIFHLCIWAYIYPRLEWLRSVEV